MKIGPTLTLLLALNVNTALAQTTSETVKNIAGTYQHFINTHHNETAWLETDRNIYLTGDTVFFKAYALNDITHHLQLKSNNLFVDLVSDSNAVIAQLVLDNKSRQTSSAIGLPDTLPSGFYWIRSYTTQMLKGDSESIYIAPIYVLNKNLKDANNYNKNYERHNNAHKAQYDVRFFAERIVDQPNILSSGILQITNSNGMPVATSGNVMDGKTVIAPFSTDSFGLARISFLYNEPKKYHLSFNDRSVANNVVFEMPQVTTAQISAGNQTDTSVSVYVTIAEKTNVDFTTTLLALHGDNINYSAVGKGNYGLTIPLQNFAGGITSLLLFDSKEKLLAVRKIYINKTDVALTVAPSKEAFATRDAVNLAIKMNDSIAPAVLSVSVQDEQLLDVYQSTTATSLPLFNEIAVAQWLAKYSQQQNAATIDKLMTILSAVANKSIAMTANANDKEDNNFTLLNLTGKVINDRGRPVNGRTVTAFSKSEGMFFSNADTTAQNGNFVIPIPQHIDSFKVALQIRDRFGTIRTEEQAKVDLFQFPVFATPVILKTNFTAANTTIISALAKQQVDTLSIFQGKGWLKPIIVTTQAKPQLNYDITRRISNTSEIVTSEQFRYGGYGAISNALLRVPGVSLAFGDISIFGPTLNMSGEVYRPILIVDGIQQGYASLLEALNMLQPADIDFIEVIKGGDAAIYGMRGGNGVISINTKHSPSTSFSNTSFNVIQPVTYAGPIPFAIPDYNNTTIKNSNQPDARTTIYWRSDVLTDTTGAAQVMFYSADKPAQYIVTITGITQSGEYVFSQSPITIKQ